MADYVAPKESGRVDYIGGFAVTAGHGVEEFAKEFENNQDDYNSIMAKALGDRFAEAFAEYMHYKVRKEYWGYDKNENLSPEDLIRENTGEFVLRRGTRLLPIILKKELYSICYKWKKIPGSL